MAKAILELEMPESCWECQVLYKELRDGEDVWLVCTYLNKSCPQEGKRLDCPLKLADEDCQKAEWVNSKCRGFQVSRWNNEPIEKCKNCKDFEEYKGVKQE